MSHDNSGQYSDQLQFGRREIFLFATTSRPALESTQPLTTHLQLVLRLRVWGATQNPSHM